MFYVNAYDVSTRKYSVTDTDDGVVEWYTPAELKGLTATYGMKIEGVSADGVRVVSFHDKTLDTGFFGIESSIAGCVRWWSEDYCRDFARGAGFFRKTKGLEGDALRQLVMEHIYNQSIQDVVESCRTFSNSVMQVDASDRVAIVKALQNYVCLVLQVKANGTLTAFVCTAGVKVIDQIYGAGVFDAVYLTKQLYHYTHDINKLRPRRPVETANVSDITASTKGANLLNVYSCALRFKLNEKTGIKEISSPFYTVNTDKVFMVYAFNNPKDVAKDFINELSSLLRS